MAMKLKDTNYKGHWNIEVLCDNWKIMSDINMSHNKISDFVPFPFFGFILIIKLRNFDFKSHWNILIFLDKNDMAFFICRFEYILLKNLWFSVACIFSLHFSHETETFRFSKSFKYFKIFWSKKMMSNLIMYS